MAPEIESVTGTGVSVALNTILWDKQHTISEET